MQRISLKSILFLLLGIILFFVGKVAYVQIAERMHHFTPQRVSLTLEPPENALTAQVASLSGAVKKEGRMDDSFHDIPKITTLVEGESVATDSTSSATITFPTIVTITVAHNSQIDYVNGLPNAQVLRQPVGLVVYETTNTIQPFSIRTLALLVQWTGKAHFSIVTTSNTVTITLTQGALTLAYSDDKNNTQVVTVHAKEKAVFDNTTSKLTTF